MEKVDEVVADGLKVRTDVDNGGEKERRSCRSVPHETSAGE